MKKYLISLLLLSILYATDSFALSIALYPQNTDMSSAGQTFKIDVAIEDVTDLGGFQFDILYDPAIVEIQANEDVTLGNFLESTGANVSSLGPVIDNETGKLTFGAFAFGGNTGAQGSGILASIVFTIKNIQNSFLNLNNVQLAAMTDGSSLIPDSIEDAYLTDGITEPDPIVEPTPTYTISFTAQDNGTIEGSTEQQVEQGSSSSSFKAVPDQGYIFKAWTGDYTGSENPLTIPNINADMTITAVFEQEPVILPQTYTITFSAYANGSIQGNTEQNIEEDNNTVPVTAVPDQGYYFLGWTGDYIGTENPLIISNVTSDMNITADFEIKTYTVKVTAGTGGTITPANDVIAEYGENAEFNIIPDKGYKIETVLIDNESVGPVTSWIFTEINTGHTIEALFALEEEIAIEENTEDDTAAEPENESESNDGGGGGSCFIGSIS